jgi:ribosomal protein L32
MVRDGAFAREETAMTSCPECGHPIEAHTCPNCGEGPANGAAPTAGRKPKPPAEVSGWVTEKTPPDLVAWARQTFDEAEFLAGVREVEQTGGVKFEEFIGEIEERVRRRG